MKVNYRVKYETLECELCHDEEETQEHVLKYKDIIKATNNEKDLEFSKLMDGRVVNQLEIAKPGCWILSVFGGQKQHFSKNIFHMFCGTYWNVIYITNTITWLLIQKTQILVPKRTFLEIHGFCLFCSE